MRVLETQLPGVLIIEPQVFGDERGFFKESFQLSRYRELGIRDNFVQDNFSKSKRGVLRGLHFQTRQPQGKLVSCVDGAVYDVAVDITPSSATFGCFVGVELSGENHKQLWIPAGYAHGFCVVSETAIFHYKCTDFYDAGSEAGVRWDDVDIGIGWPCNEPQVSEKDKKLPSLQELVRSDAS